MHSCAGFLKSLKDWEYPVLNSQGDRQMLAETFWSCWKGVLAKRSRLAIGSGACGPGKAEKLVE